MYRIGLDIGSTTAKIAVIDRHSQLIYSNYLRHNTQIYETVSSLLLNASARVGDDPVSLTITGSAGMGVCENTGITFVQELVAATEVVQKLYQKVKTLVDIGGEDSKMIFFPENRIPDIRMNGSCAGGTGAFIDQMASLLHIDTSEMSLLAENHKNIYPIASRCGVFAKTDVQNLISRKIPKADIAASVFHAIAVQSINTLARGCVLLPQVIFIGGPFTFLPELVKTFVRVLNISEGEIIRPEHPEIISALGAALLCTQYNSTCMSQLMNMIDKIRRVDKNAITNRLHPLFQSSFEWEAWEDKYKPINIEQKSLANYKGAGCFLGIDSGSTTTKIVAIGEEKELLYCFYSNNEGQPVETAYRGLKKLRDEAMEVGINLVIQRSVVTGYGEELIKAAFNIDDGVVETIAHYAGASYIDPNVSFILDIGGQDMKAIFVSDGIIQRIELNESCSSGCGSFIETFAHNLGISIQDFSLKACQSPAPCDLGTRCTVFMNSKIKQSYRENASVEDIAAGLSYSVIKNALIKVLNVNNMDELGEQLTVQGGTFRNPSIRRALEIFSGKHIVMTNRPEMIGAYGAAIIASNNWKTILKRAITFKMYTKF